MGEKKRLRVVIVGGGIGGLVLANCLQHAGVDFTIIEKRDRLDPDTGASIGILPNGARVLDQIGCYQDLVNVTASMNTTASHREDGSVIGSISDSLQLMRIRTGYAVIFLDRKILLRVLADHLIDHSRVKLNTTVKEIEQTPDNVLIRCNDGNTVEGDIVVGADGTYSFVRQEMWRHASLMGDDKMFEEDKKAMSAEYMCLFGISSGLKGMASGQTDRTYAKDKSTLSYVGKDGQIFWFVFSKMDQVYHSPSIPRYSTEDAEKMVGELGSLPIRENGAVTVRDLYGSRRTSHLVAIEEAKYQHWSYGRFVCLGDSIHKMTANLGAGASSATESAAALSNVLVPLSEQHSDFSIPTIQQAFKQYQSARSLRVGRAMAASNALIRIQALKGTREYIYTHYIAPRSEDSAAETFSSFVIGAEKADHLPLPERSLQGTMPFNPKQGWGFEEVKSDRARKAFSLALLALGAVMARVALPKSALMQDNIIDPSLNAQNVLSILSKAVTANEMLYGIWLLEAIRSINRGTLLQLSTVFGILAMYLGYDISAPLYLFALYVYSPMQNFRASDNRLTDMSYTVTAVPLLIAFVIVPRILSQWPSMQETSSWLMKWHPYLIGAAQVLLANSIIPRTQPHDRLWAVRKDVPWIKSTFGLLTAATIVSHICSVVTLFTTGAAREVLLFSPTELWAQHAAGFSVAASVIAWLELVHHDFQQAGMVNIGAVRFVLTCIATSVVLGPGGLLGLGWLWRENILVTRRHKDAMTQENLGRGRSEKTIQA